MGNLLTKAMGNVLTMLVGNVLTEPVGKVLDIYNCAQNIELEAVALGMGSVPIGAFYDDEVKKILNLPKNMDPIYIIPIGYQK